MVYRHIFDPSAAEEYEDSFKWYEERSFVAADNFILAVEIAISAICGNPYRYRNKRDHHKKVSFQSHLFC